jgi:probable addiction module antidote protein
MAKQTREKFTAFDTADFLKSEEDVKAYIEEALAFANTDPAIVGVALGNVIRARELNMTKVAKSAGITRAGLYKAVKEGGNPAFTTVAKISAALGYELRFTAAKPARTHRARAA